jgi:hypothetical protein
VSINYGSPLFTIIWVFGWAIIVLLAWFVRGQRRERMIDRIHKERMLAIEKGLPLPELPDYESRQAWGAYQLNPRWPLGIGAIFVTLGIAGCATLSIAGDSVRQLFPWFLATALGVGLWLHYYLTRR